VGHRALRRLRGPPGWLSRGTPASMSWCNLGHREPSAISFSPLQLETSTAAQKPRRVRGNEPEAVCQAATSALTRLFEQRLDESSELVPLDGIARTRRAWWGADAHGFAAGDQTRPLSYRPGIRRVRFRCPLPSAFMT
jgi:hypothetical protein